MSNLPIFYLHLSVANCWINIAYIKYAIQLKIKIDKTVHQANFIYIYQYTLYA